MDRQVTVKFWRVEKANDETPSFSTCLKEVSKRALPDREDKIGDAYLMRLERPEQDGSFIVGDFVRRQVENIPPNAKTGRPMEPLQLGAGGSLAHRSAFRFHSGLSILALQAGQNGIRPPSISSYICKFHNSLGYVAKPVLPNEMWSKLSASSPRRFKIKVAQPHNLAMVEDANGSMQSVFDNLNDTYGGVDIFIEVSAGRKRSSFLNKDAVIDLVRALKEGRGTDAGRVKALTVGVDTGDGTEELDFLTGQIVEREVLSLPDTDVEGHYMARQEFIERMVKKHWPAIKEQMRDG